MNAITAEDLITARTEILIVRSLILTQARSLTGPIDAATCAEMRQAIIEHLDAVNLYEAALAAEIADASAR